MLSKIAAALLFAASVMSAAAPKCLTGLEIAELRRGGFYYEAEQFPKYILGHKGPEPANTWEAYINGRWYVDDDYAFINQGYESHIIIGNATNKYKISYARAYHSPTSAKCCVLGLNKPLICGYNGKSLTGGEIWLNSDGTLSLGPPSAKPKTAKVVTFISRAEDTLYNGSGA